MRQGVGYLCHMGDFFNGAERAQLAYTSAGYKVWIADNLAHVSRLPLTGPGAFFDPCQNIISAVANMAAQLYETGAIASPAGAFTPGSRLAKVSGQNFLIPELGERDGV